MKGIYLDNGATSFPKAPGVAESISNYLINIGCSVNRGAYTNSYTAEGVVYETRELICKLFKFHKPENVVFTKNITESLNIIIKGLLNSGDHVIVSSMEHNAVMRPLTSLQSKGVEFSRVQCDKFGQLNSNDIKPLIKHNTKAVIMTNASNVCGTILPLKDIGKICRENKLFFIIDCAQTAGFCDMDFKELNAHAIAFTGHKSLLGPQGTGGFLISDEFIPYVKPLIEGGTGSLSEEEKQPDYMPDKYEGGTPNTCGIFGLNAALKYILNTGTENIREKELELVKIFIDGIETIPEAKLIGLDNITNRTGVVSLDFKLFDNAIISHLLSSQYNIMTRCGLHCAPSAHKTLGTFPQGTVRFSFSHFNTVEEVNFTLDSIKKCIEKIKNE
ncbi:aminotransferase class V-fold PLP-dependent enzyme [Haloimpatiens sp. FM7330]|uniref:aminotransferase class V-fold PLP-dependent enzyme n=1 Tax=Haloimpatiens sp. FM7330 TaxID=3298610 RepID=UPI003644BFA3